MDYNGLLEKLRQQAMPAWSMQLESQLNDYFKQVKHGDYMRWQSAIVTLPDITPSSVSLNEDRITIGEENDVDGAQREVIIQNLRELMPWRKGPFKLFGIDIDAEWQSNLKWDRLKDNIQPLKGRMVLDIGCGNGYYALRVAGMGAEYVVGVDPTLLFLMQFNALKKYLPDVNVDILPIRVQDIVGQQLNFDTVFSMGVIYHRKDPLEHLDQIKHFLKPGGELVLETLIIESMEQDVLRPEGRYAKMNNVWVIPTTDILLKWVGQAGFENAKIIDITKTSIEEQRCTDWMQFESLVDYLDKEDRNKTIEGHPAPIRAILTAERK